MKDRKRVILEPELEEIAMLWTANKCLDTGKQLKRWGHQLIVKGRIMLSDARGRKLRRTSPPNLPQGRARLN